jgi:hypothetical protein
MILSNILTILHFLVLLVPILIFFIPTKYLRKQFKYIFLILIFVPIHWNFFDGQCLSTIISKKLGDMKDTETTSGFSEKYLKWLYKPIMNIIGWEWNNEGLSKMVYLHWSINYFLIWYFLFFVGKKNLF